MAYAQISWSKTHLIQNYAESTFCKLLCKRKDRAAAENKNNIIYETDYSRAKEKVALFPEIDRVKFFL